MNIELSDGQIDEVVLFELQRHSDLLMFNIANLNRKRSKSEYEQEDLDRFVEAQAAMKVLLGYYGSQLN